MKRIFIRLGIAALAVALLVTGLVFATSATENEDDKTYAKLDGYTETINFNSPGHKRGTSENGISADTTVTTAPSTKTLNVKNHLEAMAEIYANSKTCLFFSAEFLMSDNMVKGEIRYRTYEKAEYNGKKDTVLLKFRRGSASKQNGGFLYIDDTHSPSVANGWHHVSIVIKQSQPPTYTLTYDVYIDGVSAGTDLFLTNDLYGMLYKMNGDTAVAAAPTASGIYSYFNSSTTTEGGYIKLRDFELGYGTAPKYSNTEIGYITYNLNGGEFVDLTGDDGYNVPALSDSIPAVSYPLPVAEYYFHTDDVHTLPAPVREGYQFKGWYDNPDFSGTALTSTPNAVPTDGDGKPVTLTLYAKFEEPYDVTCITNGGSEITPNVFDFTLPAGTWTDGTAFFDGGTKVTLTKDTTFTKIEVNLLDGASVRMKSDTGLRFETEVNKAMLDQIRQYGTVTVGTLILPTDLLGVGALTIDTAGARSISSDMASAHTMGDTYTFYASLTGILPQNHTRKFSAVSFIKVVIGEETTIVYTAYDEAKNSRSIYDVAYAAYNDRAATTDAGHLKPVGTTGTYSPYSAEQLAIAKSFVDKVAVLTRSSAEQFAVSSGASSYYTSPYTVSYADGKLTLTISGGMTAGDVATVLINGKAYTRGWVKDTATAFTVTAPAYQD